MEQPYTVVVILGRHDEGTQSFASFYYKRTEVMPNDYIRNNHDYVIFFDINHIIIQYCDQIASCHH